MANNENMAHRASDSEVDAVAMGARVRAIRQMMGLSSAELALQAGLSVGVISQIERGQANPSLRTLERLRLALDVPLMVLLEGPGSAGTEPAFVRRRHARPRLMVGNMGLSKDILSPPDSEGLRFMVITLPPGVQSEDVLTQPLDMSDGLLAVPRSPGLGVELDRAAMDRLANNQVRESVFYDDIQGEAPRVGQIL